MLSCIIAARKALNLREKDYVRHPGLSVHDVKQIYGVHVDYNEIDILSQFLFIDRQSLAGPPLRRNLLLARKRNLK